jgi:hypothetical protein
MIARLALAFAAVSALTIVPAIIEGQYTNRWSTPNDLTAAAKKLDQLPRDLPSWKFSQEGEPLSEDVCRGLGIANYLSRDYTNRETGAIVRVLLMVGQSGPLVRHPPYICYANMANEQIGPMTKFKVDATNPAGEFNLLEYKRARSVANDRFLVAYAMASSPIWKVPDSPRIEFGAAPLLYKIQMLTPLDPTQARETGEAILKRFADEFSTAFQKYANDVAHEVENQPAS